MNWTSAALLLIGQVGASPSPAISAVRADLAGQSPTLRPYLRYLSFENRTAEERETVKPVYWGHPQHLSRSSLLTRPATVAGGLLMRVNLKDYGWSAETWEKLPDPYYTQSKIVVHVETKDHPAGVPWTDGKTYSTPFKVKVTLEERVIAPARWLVEDAAPADAAMFAEIAAWTHSNVPIVRADWFLNSTAAQQGRDGYGVYDFLAIKTEADFFKLVGFDEKLASGFRFEIRGAVAISGVTLQPRALERWDTLGGGIWITLDYKKNSPALKVTGRDIRKKKPDGKEGYAHGPNSFLYTYAANGDGKLVDAVPGDIASWHTSRSNNKQVQPNISCYECHGPSGGLQDIDEWYRNLLNPPLELIVDDEEAQAQKEQYLRDHKGFLVEDRARFERAVKTATGLDAKKYAAAYYEEFSRYEDAKVTTAWAAKDFGMTEEEFRGRLLLYIKASSVKGSKTPPLVDNVLSGFVHEGARARPVPIKSWEESIPEAYRVMRATEK